MGTTVVGRLAPPVRRRSRPWLALGLGLGALAVVVVLSIAVGASPTTPGQVWDALVAPTGAPSDVVVRELRLPRTLLGILVGAALGVAGVLMQGHTRNPLADPGLLGISGGAAFCVVLSTTVLGVTDVFGYVWFAFAGAALAALLVFTLGAASRGGPTPVTLALAGLAVSELLLALTSAMVLGEGPSLDAYRFWAAGALDDRGAALTLQVLPFVLLGLVLAIANVRALDVLALGEDSARGLGQDVTRARLVGLVAVTLLTGASVAVAGPIGFVGLVAPHVVRSLVGPAHGRLIPLAALVGAVLVLAADVVGRLVVRPAELAVGIVLGIVGAPFFVALIRRRMVKL
ncbi:FecCD family ABC transporter permease [Actinomycetospora straminea]|uniref:Iron chelate uptake ABC transporter family permease subunit n=1 Tax=Actinomycetospora straminea TaxID=663607 RepID=A0ABP9EV14_9PSEU|nr:iron ABC transporter permease [Actinomycetospora straminea]MDD7933611.1 iron ABC transporter permease [Actinomycetospora straminea]